MTDSLGSGNSKPTGVDLLVILAVIGGIFDILGAVLLLVTSVSLSWFGTFIAPGTARVIFLILSAISFLLLSSGATSFFLAYGLRKGRGWAWSWARASAVVGLAASIIAMSVGIGVAGVASNALTIYYLTRTDVRAFFGKGSLPDSRTFTGPSIVVERFCVHCGNRLNGEEAYCTSCGFKQ